jgi:drug/metabolite transporter (DMT)-like permease
MISVYIVWGSTYLAIMFAVQSIPPFLMAGTRFLIAGAVLYIWRRLIAKDTVPQKIEWRSAAIVGFFLLVAGNGSVVWAEQHVPSGIAALLVGSAPLWMVLIDAFRPGGRKPTGATMLGVGLGFRYRRPGWAGAIDRHRATGSNRTSRVTLRLHLGGGFVI